MQNGPLLHPPRAYAIPAPRVPDARPFRLDVHVTLDLGGQCTFGPDVSGWPLPPDYSFEAGLEDKFCRPIRRYYPDLPDGSLHPGYAGIGPKVTGPTQPAGDIIIQRPDAHGVSVQVNLFGIESPRLTSCLAIAEEAVAILNRHPHNAFVVAAVR
jgi:L-2-hydroxyglutarate oxidase LhgO